MTDPTCPEAEHHGNPFRYCPVKGCGWMEQTTTTDTTEVLGEALSATAYPTLSVIVDAAEVLKHFIRIDSDAGGDLPDAPDEAALVFLERVKNIFDPLPGEA